MLRVVQHPDGVQAGWRDAVEAGEVPEGATRLEDVVPGNDRLTAEQQLRIYAYAYYRRLIDVMAEEYPGVLALLGEEGFDGLVRAFLQEHPSTSWTLNRLSVPFPAWLRSEGDRRGDGRMLFAADVARVERAMDDVWDAPFEDPISADALAAVPPEGWADLHLVTAQCLRLLALDHPVTDFMDLARAGEPADIAPPTPSWVLVHRRGTRRFRPPLTHEQFDLLSALVAGGTLGEALEAAADREGADVAAMMAGVGEWLRDFAARGLFTSLGTRSGP